ncbi:MAG: alpha/beta fold hydrolase [Pseudomonadales bacterium]
MSELTVERLFSDPPLFGGVPQNPQFSPDGRFVTYLRAADDDRERLDLWRMDLASGEHVCWVPGTRLDGSAGEASAAEKAERERRRQFARGITAYRFSPDGRSLLLPVDGAGFLMDVASGELRRITPAGSRQTDLRFSPDGASVTWVRDGNLIRYDLAGNREVALTRDGGGTVSNGLADFIAQEEMHRFDGYWWSPDSAWLAFTRVDESPIAESQRFEILADEITTVPQRYPYAGAANAHVRLLVLHVSSGRLHELPYQVEPDDYLARVGWLDGRVSVQRQSRDQKTLTLSLFDPDSGAWEQLLEERAATWVNLHDNLMPIDEPDGQGPDFLWTSERTGHSHLYRYRAGELQPLTSGDGRINRVLWANRQRALVSGWFDTPTEQHLFEVALNASPGQPGAMRRLTARAGWHDPTVSSDGKRVVDRLSSLDLPGRLDLIVVDPEADEEPRSLVTESVSGEHPYVPYLPHHRTPRLGTLTAADGQTLHYRLTEPRGPEPAGGFPVIVNVYGGPGVQRVKNEWPPLLLQLLSHRGYGVIELDNRGTGNRDRRFEAAIHRRLGAAEVQDQIEGARFLATVPWVNADRIGVFGHSYGGYMALMCLLQRPDVFKAAVAVAPVTDWRLYDTHYTERYLETPESNPEGYAASAVTSHADRLDGHLLIVHGMADDNVLYTHSTRLFRTLQASNLAFEMMAYPGSKHGLQERDVSIHRFTQLLEFFGRNL